MFVETRRSQSVEDVVSCGLGLLLEKFEVLEDLRVDLDFVVETNTVFTQEIEYDSLRGLQSDMLELQRAATDRVGFILSLLVTSTECKLIDEVNSSSTLAVSHHLRIEIFSVVLPNAIDVLLEFSCLLKLLEVTLTLDVRVGCKHDVLVGTVDVFLPHGEPCAFMIVLDLLPAMTCGRLRDLSLLTNIDGDLLGHDALLHASSLGMLATTTEQARRFDAEVADLLLTTVPHAVHVRRLRSLPLGLERLLLCRWESLFLRAFCIEPLKDGLKVALLELLDLDCVSVFVLAVSSLVQVGTKVLKEVLVESWVLDVVSGV